MRIGVLRTGKLTQPYNNKNYDYLQLQLNYIFLNLFEAFSKEFSNALKNLISFGRYIKLDFEPIV